MFYVKVRFPRIHRIVHQDLVVQNDCERKINYDCPNNDTLKSIKK